MSISASDTLPITFATTDTASAAIALQPANRTSRRAVPPGA